MRLIPKKTHKTFLSLLNDNLGSARVSKGRAYYFWRGGIETHMQMNKHYQEILKVVNQLTYSRDKWEIFCDFVEMSAICISNCVDLFRFDTREHQYLNTIKKYTPEHQKLFPVMFAELVLALEYELATSGFTDILGNLFHELELHNKYRGQYFTPQNICNMMGKMLFGDKDRDIATNGFISISEPAAGSGAMVLGFAQAVKDNGYNHSKELFVTAVDIDVKCTHMCYIQLALYGIPAVVIHGNTLTLEEWPCWYTPAYILDGWGWRKKRITETKKAELLSESVKDVILPTPQEAAQIFEQLNLFGLNEGGQNENSVDSDKGK